MERQTLITITMALLLAFAGCTGSSEYESPQETTTTTMNADQIYDQSYTEPDHPDTKVEELKWTESKYQQVNVTRVELLVAEKINQFRAEHNTSGMRHDPKLANIARYHSWEMGDLGYFAHKSPEDGDTVSDWLAEYNYTYNKWEGENIAISVVDEEMLNSYDPEEEMASEIFYLWRTSDSHRKLMIEDYYKLQGVGIYIEKDGTYYATLMVVQ